MKPGRGYLFIRAVVEPSVERGQFDAWYDRHLQETVDLLRALRGWRYWSDDESPGAVHYAVYEFLSPGDRERAMSSSQIEGLITDFTATWGDKVQRVRSRVVVAHAVES